MALQAFKQSNWRKILQSWILPSVAPTFRTTIPKHTVSRIISVIQLAESMVIEEQMESHGKDVGELGQSKDVSSFYYSTHEDRQGLFSFATTKVINRWTTFPLPSLEQWQEASKTDPDISHLIDRIKSRRPVILASLLCRRYYQIWAKGLFRSRG